MTTMHRALQQESDGAEASRISGGGGFTTNVYRAGFEGNIVRETGTPAGTLLGGQRLIPKDACGQAPGKESKKIAKIAKPPGKKDTKNNKGKDEGTGAVEAVVIRSAAGELRDRICAADTGHTAEQFRHSHNHHGVRELSTMRSGERVTPGIRSKMHSLRQKLMSTTGNQDSFGKEMMTRDFMCCWICARWVEHRFTISNPLKGVHDKDHGVLLCIELDGWRSVEMTLVKDGDDEPATVVAAADSGRRSRSPGGRGSPLLFSDERRRSPLEGQKSFRKHKGEKMGKWSVVLMLPPNYEVCYYFEIDGLKTLDAENTSIRAYATGPIGFDSGDDGLGRIDGVGHLDLADDTSKTTEKTRRRELKVAQQNNFLEEMQSRGFGNETSRMQVGQRKGLVVDDDDGDDDMDDAEFEQLKRTSTIVQKQALTWQRKARARNAPTAATSKVLHLLSRHGGNQAGITPDTHAHVVDVDPRPSHHAPDDSSPGCSSVDPRMICKLCVPRDPHTLGRKRHVWIVQKSVFAPNLALHDTQKIINRAFVKDWECMIQANVRWHAQTGSQSGGWCDFVHTPTQQNAMCEAIQPFYGLIKNIFKFYVATCGHANDRPYCLPLAGFIALCKAARLWHNGRDLGSEAGLAAHGSFHCSGADLVALFHATCQHNEPFKPVARNAKQALRQQKHAIDPRTVRAKDPPNELQRYQFLEAFVRMIIDHRRKTDGTAAGSRSWSAIRGLSAFASIAKRTGKSASSTARSLQDGVHELMRNHLSHACAVDPRAFREAELQCEAVDLVFKRHLQSLHRLLQESTRDFREARELHINFKQWQAMTAGLPFVTEKEVRLSFVLSTRTSANELYESSPHFRLSCGEMMEALGRLSWMVRELMSSTSCR
jgi:hypothetical protein